MKHTIEKINEFENLINEEKQRVTKIALTNVLWSFLTVEFGCAFLHDMNMINGIFAFTMGSMGIRTYSLMLDSKDLINEYEKKLEKLRK